MGHTRLLAAKFSISAASDAQNSDLRDVHDGNIRSQDVALSVMRKVEFRREERSPSSRRKRSLAAWRVPAK